MIPLLKKVIFVSSLRNHLSRNRYYRIIYFSKSYNFYSKHFRLFFEITKIFQVNEVVVYIIKRNRDTKSVINRYQQLYSSHLTQK